MEENNIIAEHVGPAPWISNVVLAPKDDGGIRVTVDMRQANLAIESTNILIRRVEDIETQLAGCQHFSKLEFKSAFHQLELDEESKKITVFHARDRLMRYRKLTMGTKPASTKLTKALLPLLHSIPEAHVIHDDLIVAAKTKQQHDRALNCVLQAIAKSGMTLNPDKCMFDKEEIPFWGLRVCKDGIKPDPEKGETSDDAKPVAFASCATTPVEQRYPQLDLEALAVDFGLRRFRYFSAVGPEMKVITDHKPLVSIFSNARKGSVRTDRIKLRHQDIKYKVIWKEGKVNPADYLSRHATPFCNISRDQQKETNEFKKTVWFLQYAPYTE
eukprot:Seg5974.1 transcript_id=Seg5974.1/GoldUCD/mRNA.D3Y31 product="Retrovirus-related Pol polyprotein from transposon 17.6" protein_id=Seg5974.1/GoldUCD/D3Y31